MAAKPPKLYSRHNWEILKGVYEDMMTLMRRVHLPLVASSLAYDTILSIIPVLAVSFAVFHAFGGMEKLLETLEPYIISNLAHGTGEEVAQALHGFIDNVHVNAVGAGGFIGLIVTTMIMLSSAETAINHIWGATKSRSVFARISAYWLFVTLGPLALAIAVGAATSSEMPLTRLLPGGAGKVFLSVAILFCIFQFVPNCRVNWRYSFISAALTSVFWDGASLAYKIYTQKAVSYNKIYGSLGAIPILLVWIYIMWLITLTGAAFTAALQKRFEKIGQ